MQYEVVVGSGRPLDSDKNGWGADEKLEAKVKSMIAEGWRPLGGVSTVLREDTIWVFQAMVKE